MKIPKDLIQEINDIVDKFNSNIYKDNEAKFIPVVKDSYLYLKREVNVNLESVVRLEYTWDMKNWDFAIYRYSTETYDDCDIFFPGDEYIDGTIEGAMKAGSETYPIWNFI